MKKTFLINTITGWEEPPRARHQLSFALSKNHNIVFITRNKTGFPRMRLFNPQNNITVVEPSFPINHKFRHRLPVLNEIYQRWLFKWICRNISYDHCINFDFTATFTYKYLKDAVYYCNDDFIGMGKYSNWLINKYHQRCENYVIRKASFCIGTARYLEDKLKRINPNSYLVPLGGPSLKDINITPKKINRSETITVVLMYVGGRNMNYKLINDLLTKGNIKVMCIGPRDTDFERKVSKNDNITFTGILKGVDLYRAINKADVGIAPYDINRASNGVTPNKLWQYFALGKPVVISDLPNLAYMTFPDKFIYIYKNNSSADFYGLIMKAAEENNDSLIENRSKFADSNSWDNRAKDFLNISNNYFG